MDSTSAADSACSRRSSSKRSPELAVHLAQRLHQQVDVRNAGAREAGGAPAAMARAAVAMSVSGLATERAAMRASTVPTTSASSAAPATAPWARRMIWSTWVRSAATRTAPGSPGTATYMSSRPTVSLRRVAAPACPSSAACTSGRLAWFSMVFGSGPGGKSLSARTRPLAVDQGDPVAVLEREPVDRLVPAQRIGGQRLADQAGLVLEPARDVALEIPAERPLGAPEQDQHDENEDGDGAEHQPRGEAHRARTPRSVPRNR